MTEYEDGRQHPRPIAHSVAVIGAGVSGVASAIHLKRAGLKACVFERSCHVGGVWTYDESIARDPAFPSIRPSTGDTVETELEAVLQELESGDETVKVDWDELRVLYAPPSPCYIGLKNNVSTTEMEMQTQRWRPGTEDFVSHDVLAEYIHAAAESNDVLKNIRFGTRVNRVSKVDTSWEVESTKISRNGPAMEVQRLKERFDAVIVAVGHYHAPHVPDIPGLSTWKAAFPERIKHSKSYRDPSKFAGKNVLLVGAGVSSTDIAKELNGVARSVYQVSRGGQYDLPTSMLPDKVIRIGAIKSFDALSSAKTTPAETYPVLPGIITLCSGDRLCDIHEVVLCTGYHVSLPFLRNLHADGVEAVNADDTVLVTDGQVTHNLHKDIFYIPDPSLAFVGVPYHTATFSLFEFQAIAVAAVLSGHARLPGMADMRTEYRKRLARKGSGRSFHSLKGVGEEIAYVDDLAAWINGNSDVDGDGGGVKMDGHSSEWLAAYERRLKRLQAIEQSSSYSKRAAIVSCV